MNLQLIYCVQRLQIEKYKELNVIRARQCFRDCEIDQSHNIITPHSLKAGRNMKLDLGEIEAKLQQQDHRIKQASQSCKWNFYIIDRIL